MSKYTAQIIIFLAFILICWTGCAATSADTSSSQKKENIRKLIKISGNADSILTTLTSLYDNLMTQNIRRKRPDISKKTLKLLRQELHAEIEKTIQDQGGLMDYIISIYNVSLYIPGNKRLAFVL